MESHSKSKNEYEQQQYFYGSVEQQLQNPRHNQGFLGEIDFGQDGFSPSGTLDGRIDRLRYNRPQKRSGKGINRIRNSGICNANGPRTIKENPDKGGGKWGNKGPKNTEIALAVLGGDIPFCQLKGQKTGFVDVHQTFLEQLAHTEVAFLLIDPCFQFHLCDLVD